MSLSVLTNSGDMAIVFSGDAVRVDDSNAAAAEAAAAEAEAWAKPYANRAAAIAATVASGVTRISVLDAAVGVLVYVRDPAGTALTTNGGTVNWSPVAPVYVNHYGVQTVCVLAEFALGLATTDYTTEYQAALNGTKGQLLIPGWFKRTGGVTIPADCVPHVVGGSWLGGYTLFADFNLSDTAVDTLDSGNVAGMGNMGWVCQQTAAAASGLRADLVGYPPLLDISDAQRARFGDLFMSGGINGIFGDGNWGGAKFEGRVEVGCFGIDFGGTGALDFVQINHFHSWPFLFAANANLMSIYTDGSAFSFSGKLGRIDGLKVGTWAPHKKAIEGDRGVAQTGASVIDAIQLDGEGANVNFISGNWLIGSLSGADGDESTDNITVSGGTATVSSVYGNVTSTVTGGQLQLLGGSINSSVLNAAAFVVSAGKLFLRNLMLGWPNSAARTAPLIHQLGTGFLDMAGCRHTVQAFPSVVVQCDTDTALNRVDCTGMEPHTVTVPASVGASLGIYKTPRMSATATVDFSTRGDFAGPMNAGTVRWEFRGNTLWAGGVLSYTPVFTTASGPLIIDVPGMGHLSPSAWDAPIAGYLGLNATGANIRQVMMLRRGTDGKFSIIASGESAATQEIMAAANHTSGTPVLIQFSCEFPVRA